MPDAHIELRKIKRASYAVAAAIFIGAILLAVGVTEGTSWMWITGLVLMFVFLVYGIPLVWLRNSERRKTFRLCLFLLEHESTTVTTAAGSIGTSEQETLEKVKWLLSHGYLPDYVINDGCIVQARLVDPNMQEHTAVCPNCAASFKYVGRIGQCPYCGDYYPPNTRKAQ